jgi:hypothetical protein
VFHWLNRKPALPPFSKSNPGQGTSFRVGFSNADRSWEDQADVLVMLAAVLESRGIEFERKKERLEFENGLIARPQFVELQPRDDGSVRTATTVELNHPELCPLGTFEYQHSIGSTLTAWRSKPWDAEAGCPKAVGLLRASTSVVARSQPLMSQQHNAECGECHPSALYRRRHWMPHWRDPRKTLLQRRSGCGFPILR